MPTIPLVLKTASLAWTWNGTTLTAITNVNYPSNQTPAIATVPGIVYIDGTYYVATADGTIYGSMVDDVMTWSALNFINAEVEVDGLVAIAKYLNYLVAFGVWSTEVFYDAANPPPGSPLLRVDGAFMQLGCAAARSIVNCDNAIIWMAQLKEGETNASAGRSIVMMTGFQPTKISTPFIDRIISADNLATVYSYAFKWNGHDFYVLTLVTSNITLVYDLTTKMWFQWSSMTVQGSKSVTALTYSSTTGLATATVASHGYADGDLITIAGANQTGYNVTGNITYVDANTFTFIPTGVPVTPATGTITSVGYTESYVKWVMHTAQGSTNYFLHESNGNVYKMLESDYDDAGAYINFLVRTQKVDGGNNEDKHFTRLDLIGDKVTGSAMIRYSKDDYVTQSNYRKVDLSLNRSKIDRCGRGRRKSFDIRITDSIPVRLEHLDISIDE